MANVLEFWPRLCELEDQPKPSLDDRCVVSNERLQAKLLSIAEPVPLDSEPFMASQTAEVPLLDLQLPEARWLLQEIFRQSLLMQVMGQNDGLESAELDRLCDHRCV